VHVEAVALVLGEHDDLEEPGVGHVRQGEIDEAVLAPEGDRGFGPVQRQRHQAFSFTTGKYDRQHSSHSVTLVRVRPSS